MVLGLLGIPYFRGPAVCVANWSFCPLPRQFRDPWYFLLHFPRERFPCDARRVLVFASTMFSTQGIVFLFSGNALDAPIASADDTAVGSSWWSHRFGFQSGASTAQDYRHILSSRWSNVASLYHSRWRGLFNGNPLCPLSFCLSFCAIEITFMTFSAGHVFIIPSTLYDFLETNQASNP